MHQAENIVTRYLILQETKVLEEQNPYHPYGYHEYLYPAEKKGYSGVMIYSKVELWICRGELHVFD